VASFDRNGTLRNAEKLLRQGKLQEAAAEYLRVVEDQPGDWNTKNTLGDLYARAGQVERATNQFLEVAESLREEGQYVKAAAIYKKLLKLQPDNERALLQAAELVAGQGLYADARSYLNIVLEKRKAAGDARGAAMTRVRIGGLDPADYAQRVEGAKARVEIGDANGAVTELSTVASELSEKVRYDEAIEALRLAATIDPENEDIRTQLYDIYCAAEDFTRAGECAVTSAQFVSIADSLGFASSTTTSRCCVRGASGSGQQGSARGWRTFLGRGDLQSAGVSPSRGAGDPKLLMTWRNPAARRDRGRHDAHRQPLRKIRRREEITMLGWNIGPQARRRASRSWNSRRKPRSPRTLGVGAAGLRNSSRVPSFIPALMRLVEICVDAASGLTMYCQAQLADAYVALGQVAEARFIAEDLVAREPWERANIERFRRTLELLGEPDPDGIIAERLSGQTPFTSTDLLVGVELPQPEPEPEVDEDGLTPELRAMLEEAEGPTAAKAKGKGKRAPEPEPEPEPAFDEVSDDIPVSREVRNSPTKPPKDESQEGHFELSSNAIDLQSILGDLEDAEPEAGAAAEEEAGSRAHEAHAEGARRAGKRVSRSPHRSRRHQTGSEAIQGRACLGTRARRGACQRQRHRQRLRADALEGVARYWRRGRRRTDEGRHGASPGRQSRVGDPRLRDGVALAATSVPGIGVSRPHVPRQGSGEEGHRVVRARDTVAAADARRRPHASLRTRRCARSRG
jgi:tetratricopeptide (TPR) repeat protein